MVGEHGVQGCDLEAEDVVQVVEVIQVFGHKILQTVQAPVAATVTRKEQNFSINFQSNRNRLHEDL